MKKFKVIIEKTVTGYSAHADRFSVYTTGEDMKSLTTNMVEALNYYLAESGDDNTITKRNLQLHFSIHSLFELYPINVRHFAVRIGMNYTLLSHYIQGRKKLSDKQSEKILDGLKEVGRELSEVGLR